MCKMKLTDINFPVFSIRNHYYIENIDGIIYISTYKKKWVLDNTNLPYDRLSTRR